MIIVRDKYIDEEIINILYKVRGSLYNGKLRDIIPMGDNIRVTCPFHAGGMENRPSCYIRVSDGVFHCFTDGETGGLAKFIGACFDRSIEWGENWLISNYASGDVSYARPLPKLEFNKKQKEKFLDEHILDSFESYHPYMTQRKLSADVIKKFDIKYNPETQCIVFPVRDKKGRLKYLTQRSVNSKKFIIDKDADKKCIYLLNECQNEQTVYVVESQLNALTLWGWGYPAVALLGAGTTASQMDELNNTSIKRFILAYDSDDAGRKGADKFKKLIRKDVFVEELTMPKGRDVNDLTKEEFENILSQTLKF